MGKHRIVMLNLLAALTIALTGTGCIALAVGAGVGGYAFYKGELKSTESVSLDRLWVATQSAVASLGLNVVSESKDGLSAEVKAKGADDKPITIKLERVGESSTELRIRAGNFGDESQARQIGDAIRQRL
jgi:hypothetical protein